MGLCVHRDDNSVYKSISGNNKNNVLLQSFIINSLSLDPIYNSKPGFFNLDLPKYCQIQYLIRQSKNDGEQGEILVNHIQELIDQINDAIHKMEQIDRKLTNKANKNTDQLKLQQNYSQKSERSEQQQQWQKRSQDNTLSLQLIKANINECEDNKDFPFEIYINTKKVTKIQGYLHQNKWTPVSNNQICIHDIQINVQDHQNQAKIKIVSKIQEQIQCIIPLNQITFKYLLPIPQTCNIRSKQDNQPLGHFYFKIEYWKSYEQHCKNIIKDLKIRKQQLQQLLQKIKKGSPSTLKQIRSSVQSNDKPTYIY